jgi:ketosteroid isomerase-like protein
VDVVDRVLVALNAHDLDAFVACYADDATHVAVYLVRDGLIARERLLG